MNIVDPVKYLEIATWKSLSCLGVARTVPPGVWLGRFFSASSSH